MSLYTDNQLAIINTPRSILTHPVLYRKNKMGLQYCNFDQQNIQYKKYIAK